MRTLKYYIVLFMAGLMLLPACKKEWLQLDDPNRKTAKLFWETPEDIEKGVNAAYQSLYYDGTFMRFAQCALNFRGDDVWSPSPWDVLANTGSFELVNSTIMQEWLWIAFFGGVHRSNQVLSNINNIEFESQSLKNRLQGEAYFLRGLFYYYLVTFFNNVPLYSEQMSGSDDYTLGQSPPEDTWDQVMDDFTKASELLPVSYSGSDLGRATKGAALGFLGKCQLYNHMYTEAAATLLQVINLTDTDGSKRYNLVTDYEDNFTDLNENNEESIFEIQFDRDVGGTVLGWVGQPANDWSKTTAHAITFAPTPFGWGDAALTEWVFEQFQLEQTISGEDDPRLRTTITYDYPGCTMYGQNFRTAYPYTGADTANWATMFLVRKYTNAFKTDLVDEKDWRSGINERAMRYSDILLMYAECQNELNDQTTCAQYIQMVRDRVNLPDRETEFAGYTQDEMRDQISHERLLEFCLEGHRFDDIVRWGWLDDADKLEELRDHDIEFEGYIAGKEFFSIPSAEMDLNPNLVQNRPYY